jgi:hypothetical protein
MKTGMAWGLECYFCLVNGPFKKCSVIELGVRRRLTTAFWAMKMMLLDLKTATFGTILPEWQPGRLVRPESANRESEGSKWRQSEAQSVRSALLTG